MVIVLATSVVVVTTRTRGTAPIRARPPLTQGDDNKDEEVAPGQGAGHQEGSDKETAGWGRRVVM